jgi:hypothetical protein
MDMDEHSASRTRKSKVKRQMSKVKMPDRLSFRAQRGISTLGELGQALPRRQTRFLVAPLLGMTSSRKRRSCTLVVQIARAGAEE